MLSRSRYIIAPNLCNPIREYGVPIKTLHTRTDAHIRSSTLTIGNGFQWKLFLPSTLPVRSTIKSTAMHHNHIGHFASMQQDEHPERAGDIATTDDNHHYQEYLNLDDLKPHQLVSGMAPHHHQHHHQHQQQSSSSSPTSSSTAHRQMVNQHQYQHQHQTIQHPPQPHHLLQQQQHQPHQLLQVLPTTTTPPNSYPDFQHTHSVALTPAAVDPMCLQIPSFEYQLADGTSLRTPVGAGISSYYELGVGDPNAVPVPSPSASSSSRIHHQ